MNTTELSHATWTHPSSSTPFPVAKGDCWKPQWTGRFHLMGSDWLSQLTLMEVMGVCHPQAFAALPAAHHCREGCESTAGSEEREWVSESQRERERESVRKETEDHLTGAVDLFYILPVMEHACKSSTFWHKCVCVLVDRYSTLLKRVQKVSYIFIRLHSD